MFFSMQIQYLVSRWGTDPSSMGCYSYDAVGKPHDLYERLRTPVDNLFWAGEATSERFPGTVHGAFATGVMAGNECLKRFAERCRDLEMFQPVMAKEDELITPLQISRMWKCNCCLPLSGPCCWIIPENALGWGIVTDVLISWIFKLTMRALRSLPTLAEKIGIWIMISLHFWSARSWHRDWAFIELRTSTPYRLRLMRTCG
jgi:hypothetical protein